MKQKPRSPHKRKTPKTHLRLPDLEFSKTAVLNSLTSRDGHADIAMPSTNSLTGTARSRGWH